MQEYAIEVKNVRKKFKAYEARRSGSFVHRLFRDKYYKRALRGVNFAVKRGEIVALLGRNGSGKSTLIKIMSGILYPDSGTVSVLGMNPWEERTKLAMQLGVVLGAHGQLYWNLPAMDTFALMQHIYHVPAKEFKERLNYLLGPLDLKDVYMRQVRTLSLGEQMKCNFVASVLHLPKLVILDEPTIGVDLPSKQALRNTILEMQRDYGTTFLITTHIVEDLTMADRIIVLDHGRKIYDGSRRRLEMLFGDKKVIELEFGRTVDLKKYLRFGSATKIEGNYVRLEVKQSVLKHPAFARLLANSAVADYSVLEPGLGDVLMKLYNKGGEKNVRKP